MAADMSYIEAKNLSIGYEGKEILTGINFTINKGDYLSIVGANGSGKSTLMKVILGLVPKMDGEIIYGNALKKNEVGYLPQQTLIQREFPASVEEIVLSGCQGRMGLRPFYNKEEKKLARENMERMDILDLAKACYRELSGGQQQRVLLARALTATRKVLLLDEPVTGLDPVATANMYDLISDLNKEGITIIMISHDIDAAVNYSSHILYVKQDNVSFMSVEEFLKSEISKNLLEDK